MDNDEQEKAEVEKAAKAIFAIMVRKAAKEKADEKWQTEQQKEVETTFAAVLALRDDIRIEEARDLDRAGIRSSPFKSEEEMARTAVVYSSMVWTMIREFMPKRSLVEMHQVKDVLYGLMINLLRFQSPLQLSRPRGHMNAIKAAARILCDIPEDEGKQQAHCLEIVAAFAKRMPPEREKRSPMLWVFRDQLTLECDERFETLPLEFISEKLDEMVGENVVGRGKLRTVGVAAHLAIKAKAWGFHKLASDSKVNFDTARERFSQAQKRARNEQKTARTFGKGWTLEDWERFAKDRFDFMEEAKLLANHSSHPRFIAAKEAHAIAIEEIEKLRNKKRRK
jgi:hypothetical protein